VWGYLLFVSALALRHELTAIDGSRLEPYDDWTKLGGLEIAGLLKSVRQYGQICD
jgi:hypothetical protein